MSKKKNKIASVGTPEAEEAETTEEETEAEAAEIKVEVDGEFDGSDLESMAASEAAVSDDDTKIEIGVRAPTCVRAHVPSCACTGSSRGPI